MRQEFLPIHNQAGCNISGCTEIFNGIKSLQNFDVTFDGRVVNFAYNTAKKSWRLVFRPVPGVIWR
jgi:isocitrate dehydrogenase kinase/phosphatase